MVAVIFLINQKENHVSEIYASDKPVHQKLKDNSAVTLGINSKIVLDKDYGVSNRKLSLTGKADFSVIHDEKMPFIIESQGVFIEDLGTIFSVESEPESDTVYVVVNEGIVRLYDDHGSEIIIKAGEKAWYIRSQKKIITDIDSKTVKFDFKDTRLADAVILLKKPTILTSGWCRKVLVIVSLLHSFLMKK
jgi:ferric-dicitrate binding protein FerR (iron transport regulator)